jgi:hypothetical protein
LKWKIPPSKYEVTHVNCRKAIFTSDIKIFIFVWSAISFILLNSLSVYKKLQLSVYMQTNQGIELKSIQKCWKLSTNIIAVNKLTPKKYVCLLSLADKNRVGQSDLFFSFYFFLFWNLVSLGFRNYYLWYVCLYWQF